jgi:fibronectin type 3 domain-containing protein
MSVRRKVTTIVSTVGLVAVVTALTSAAAAADTTPPGAVTNLTAQSNAPTSVTLHWTNPTATDFSYVHICRATGTTAPTRPCSGVNLAKPATSYTDTHQLLPSTHYTYAVWAFDKAGNASTRKSVTVTTQAKTPPGNVTGLTATALANGSIKLDWTNPGDADFAGVRLCRATGTSVPTLPCGVKLAAPTNTYTDSNGLVANTQYTYAVFAYDTVGNTASGVHVSATAAATPPGNVTGLTATALSSTSIKLDWTNPGDSDFAGVRICRGFGSTAPTLPCAGVNVTAPTNTYTDSANLTPNTQYTYAVFAYDTMGSAASGASVTVTTLPEPLSANVTGLTATAVSATSIKLDWTNPEDPNFAGVLICRNYGSTAPTTPCSGVTLPKPTNTYTDDYQVLPGFQHTYTVFALNTSGDPSSGTSVSVTVPSE